MQSLRASRHLSTQEKSLALVDHVTAIGRQWTRYSDKQIQSIALQDTLDITLPYTPKFEKCFLPFGS
jgi:hypothetical protein